MKRGEVLPSVIIALGVVLRVLLWWVNPPQNSFDDHFQPIFMIMQTGHLPSKYACFQCYHPPVFYWVSAAIGKAALSFGISMPHLLKLLQFLPCLYGCATLWVCHLILRKIPLPAFARTLSLAAVCLLPRHIYMSAMHSNDTLSYLTVALCVYLAIVVVEKRFAPPALAALSVALTVSIFVKYTDFAVLPAALVIFVAAFFTGMLPAKKALALGVATFVLPLALLGAYIAGNLQEYRCALPWNITLYDPSTDRPRDPGGIDFTTFKPWEEIGNPILAPGQIHSFWTVVYGGMWFDNEPYFVPSLDGDQDWWQRYFRWYLGRGPYPGENRMESGLKRVEGSGLEALGLLPLVFMIPGFYFCLRRRPAYGEASADGKVIFWMFPVLFLFTAAGVIAQVVKVPVYNSMKASYLLNSLPAFAVFLGLGLALCENRPKLKITVTAGCGALFALVTLHILHLVGKLG